MLPIVLNQKLDKHHFKTITSWNVSKEETLHEESQIKTE